MPRYSPIAPIHLLEEMQEHDLLGDYLLLLAHEVYKEPARYEELVFNMREKSDDTFIIMDNGVIELGNPVPVQRLIEAANYVQADCVVSPDVLGDMGATKKLVMDQGRLISRDFPLMLIPQGQDFRELIACIEWLAECFPVREGEARYWGVPRWIANELGTRSSVLNYLASYQSPCKIHLLGMSTNWIDDTYSLKAPYVMGIDSANPLVLGKLGFKMELGVYQHAHRGDYWKSPTLTDMMAQNVKWMHNVASTV